VHAASETTHSVRTVSRISVPSVEGKFVWSAYCRVMRRTGLATSGVPRAERM
jgi:hypothetical protein